MSHRPRKRFGQHFLHDDNVLYHMLKEIQLRPKDSVLEIGPGQGALTRYLLKEVSHLTAIEIDRDLAQLLRQRYPEQISLVEADALTVDYSRFGPSLRVVGNLPYNISTPLLFHLLTYKDKIDDMHFMLQKEVVERLASTSGKKSYGRLSVMMQYYFEVEYLFTVPPEAFDPPPKVESAIVRLTPYRQCPYPHVEKEILENLVAHAFSMRRKTLANNLKPLIAADQLAAIGIDPKMRPEQIDVATYARLAEHLELIDKDKK